MSFYTEYRPHSFSEVLGQDQATAILKKQAVMHQFHHAYLLHGPSGSGKTTTARILAAALNCETMNGTGEPCGVCPSCQAVIEGRHWDVMEIDGARFRGIDDIKDLCYKAYFSPMSKKKVYIIDECHQLTEPAWAALLKLVEEPPPHLVIILCTTARDKVPDTIASRCQLYPFNKVEPECMKAKLTRICQTIGIEADARHLDFIAQSSNGNMRTAENILEQVCLLKR
ncbi:MAG: DNA polymerase III subunit gamma/tau [Dehalococcoidales bacterium]|nr:DNA polymerase III subunit gamma/tau [Dehalococcoidales bacterium]